MGIGRNSDMSEFPQPLPNRSSTTGRPHDPRVDGTRVVQPVPPHGPESRGATAAGQGRHDLATRTAIRLNPLLRRFFARLAAAGKPKMQAVGACMRKLAMLCYGVLKNRQPFDPAWASRRAR